MQINIAGWIIGIAIGGSVGLILPAGIGVIAGLAIAIVVAKAFIRMSIIEIEEDEENFI